MSRAISDLVKAGLLRRHYAGYATNHPNRGGGRHAVYVIEPETLAAMGKGPAKTSVKTYVPARVPASRTGTNRQGQLFAL